jgi:AcrR family transcriptional regulator
MENDLSHDTRMRLADAAGEIFAREGYHKATIRKICRKAGTNPAAVHYHFGSKEELYAYVLKHTLSVAIEKYPPDLGVKQGAGPEERLYSFVRSFLYRIFDEGQPAWHGRLMARELNEPTAAFDQMMEEAIRPLHNRLKAIVTELIGGSSDEQRLRMCTISVIGQCLFFYHSWPCIERLYRWKIVRSDLEGMARHITRFSLSALTALAGDRVEIAVAASAGVC